MGILIPSSWDSGRPQVGDPCWDTRLSAYPANTKWWYFIHHDVFTCPVRSWARPHLLFPSPDAQHWAWHPKSDQSVFLRLLNWISGWYLPTNPHWPECTDWYLPADLQCVSTHWLGLSCQCPLIDTYLRQPLRASPRVPVSAVKAHRKKKLSLTLPPPAFLVLSLTLPFLCVSIPSHLSLCPLSASQCLAFSVSLWPCSFAGSLPPLWAPSLWLFPLPPSSPPTEKLSPPLPGGPHCSPSRTWHSVTQSHICCYPFIVLLVTDCLFIPTLEEFDADGFLICSIWDACFPPPVPFPQS